MYLRVTTSKVYIASSVVTVLEHKHHIDLGTAYYGQLEDSRVESVKEDFLLTPPPHTKHSELYPLAI